MMKGALFLTSLPLFAMAGDMPAGFEELVMGAEANPNPELDELQRNLFLNHIFGGTDEKIEEAIKGTVGLGGKNQGYQV